MPINLQNRIILFSLLQNTNNIKLFHLKFIINTLYIAYRLFIILSQNKKYGKIMKNNSKNNRNLFEI